MAIRFNSIATGFATEETGLTIEYLRSCIPVIVFAFLCFSTLMTSITSSMISLEGKALNLLKSLPLKPYTIIKSKVLTSLVIVIPCVLVGDLIVFVRFGFDIIEIALILLASIFIPLVAETFGIIVNLKYPRMDAKNDTEVVKQSVSSSICVFTGMALIGVTCILLFKAVSMQIPNNTILLIFTAVYAIIYLVLEIILRKICDKSFENISV